MKSTGTVAVPVLAVPFPGSGHAPGDGEQVAADAEQRRHRFHRALSVEEKSPASGVIEPVVDVAVQPEGALQPVALDIVEPGVGA